MRFNIWQALQALSIILAIAAIGTAFVSGLTSAYSSEGVNVVFYVASLFVAVLLVGALIYFSLRAKRKH
jgi:multidrug efflux pump subunit AcrB